MSNEINTNNQEIQINTEKKRDRKKFFITIIILIVIIFVAIVFFYWFFNNKTTTVDDKKNITKTKQECGELIADGGVISSNPPFEPVFRAQITGLYDRTRAVCKWTVDGVTLPATFSYKGYCIFKGTVFNSVGSHKITYSVDYLSGCPKSATVTVK